MTGAAIAGLGVTDVGKVYGRTARDFAADAVRRACDDAGLRTADLDGLLVTPGLSPGLDVSLIVDLGVAELKLLTEIGGDGTSVCTAVSYAAMAIAAGQATTVACVFADAPLRRGTGAGAVFEPGERQAGFEGLLGDAGLAPVQSRFALAARRHMETFGTTSGQLGAIAVAQREWAARNPLAQQREPITVADHQNSRLIADPLRLLDCCLVGNGGAAVIVTSAERAAALAQPPVHVLGFAQSHPVYREHRGSGFGLVSGAAESGRAALRMAGAGIGDVDIAELYDCFTIAVLLTLEDYGFCGKGEGGPFVEEGNLMPGRGRVAVNTGGGQLSGFSLWGMTPLVEAVVQARGAGGDRQAARNRVIMVSGNGGAFDHHGTLVLGPDRG
ncbi:Acetyl-CoA acetyltransferase [Amycolatopsis xylanica]|uniref:Acetyl-CoA acetyltransferase n=1 Tax=Amycolatopsis xylanica TaxID=589385 RepID=A0A1H3SD22_9PSEU|nr:thiolase family protein [Amycolatopsis xylanica]SDZ35906.1 Acetyl-CoA acetyltransferase [Amycolatopsis xylanica]